MSLIKELPEPTFEDPYAQVKYIFNIVSDTKSNTSTKKNYLNGCNFYIRYLEKNGEFDFSLQNDPRFYLKKHWDEFCLIKLESYISETNQKNKEGYLTSYTIAGLISAIRKVMEYAFYHDLGKTKEFYNVLLSTAERETNSRESYGKVEYDDISNMLVDELKYVYKVLSGNGYRKTGKGRDPRKVVRKGVPRGTKVEGNGWKEIDNVRWYFENVMDCIPLMGTPENKQKHNAFFANTTNKFKHLGGLNGVYKEWGVTSLINAELIMPLAVKLVSETGLNPESLWDLDVDCYQDNHPLSGVPYLRYFKRRSRGEKEMHISPNGSNTESKEFREHQAKIIEKTIRQIKKLTETIRDQAPDELKNKLFIYQSDTNRHFGKISVLNSNVSSNWCKKMVNKHNLMGEDNQKLKFNLARFRPTRITKLVELGEDFFNIQHEAGHKSIITTIRYIAKNRLDIKAKEETNAALKRISENSYWAKDKELHYAENTAEESNIIYKGIMCDCKNPYDPPREVKLLKDYQSGQVCNRYNMCLFCHNVIIFKNHLPLIASYRTQILTAMSTNNSELPNEFLYRQTLDVIESLLDPEISEFDAEDIKLAIELAENSDIMIDPYVYKPVVDILKGE